MRRGLSHSSACHGQEGPIARVEHLNARVARLLGMLSCVLNALRDTDRLKPSPRAHC
jgi:hypothetical protein